MSRRPSRRIAAAFAVAAVLGTAAAVRAQNATTGTLGGVVRDAQQGVLPGAGVVAIHAPTGTRYEAFTRADGRFDFGRLAEARRIVEAARTRYGYHIPGGFGEIIVRSRSARSSTLALVLESTTTPNRPSAVNPRKLLNPKVPPLCQITVWLMSSRRLRTPPSPMPRSGLVLKRSCCDRSIAAASGVALRFMFAARYPNMPSSVLRSPPAPPNASVISHDWARRPNRNGPMPAAIR